MCGKPARTVRPGGGWVYGVTAKPKRARSRKRRKQPRPSLNGSPRQPSTLPPASSAATHCWTAPLGALAPYALAPEEAEKAGIARAGNSIGTKSRAGKR